MPLTRIISTAICLLTPLAFGQDLENQSDLAEIPPAGGILDWTLRLQPQVWLGSAAGEIRMPGGSSEMTMDMLNLDESALRPVLELDYRKDRWGITLSGFYLDEESTVAARSGGSWGGVGFSAGDRLDSSFDYLSLEAMGSYELWRYEGEGHPGWPDLETRVELMGGVRFTSLEVEFSATSGSVGLGSSSARHLFAEPVIGARWQLGLYQQWVLETDLNVGGFTTGSDHSSFSFDVNAQFAYRPTRHLGALFGYRQLLSTFEDGTGASAFEYSGATAGMFLSVELRY